MKLPAKIKNGIICLPGVQDCDAMVLTGRDMQAKKLSTNPERRYYRGLVLPMITDALNACGKTFDFGNIHLQWTDELVHEVLVKGFFIKKYGVKGTTELTTIQFEGLMEDLRRYGASELEVIIPLPRENLEQLIDYYNKERIK